MIKTYIIVIGIIGLFGACANRELRNLALDGDSSSISPMPPPPIVRFVPVDLTTGLGTTLPEARIIWYRDPVEMGLLQELAAAITLRTWPDLTSVSMTSTIEDSYQPNLSRIEFSTTAPLTDRWYALHISSLPGDFTWPSYQFRFVLSDGSVIVRFRPGSQPSFINLRICDKEDSRHSIRVGFSEPVKTALFNDLVSISQRDVSSFRIATGEMPITVSNSLEYVCDGIDTSRSLQLNISAGLVSLTGVPVTDIAENPTPLRYAISLSDMIAGEPGCRMFIP